MILDPIFIYTLKMGMFGAALSTIISLAIVLCIIIYWIYIKKDTYLNPTLSNFRSISLRMWLEINMVILYSFVKSLNNFLIS